MRILLLNPAYGHGFCKSKRWFAKSHGRVQRHPDYLCREIPLPDFRYFRSGNTEKLKEKMIELFRHGISEEEKQEYRELIMENYKWSKIVEQTLAVYNRLL